MENVPAVVYACIVVSATMYFVKRYFDPPNAIPTAGGLSARFLPHIPGLRPQYSTEHSIQEGLDKFKGAPFKVAGPNGWMVVVTGRDIVEDIKARPDNELSFRQFTNQEFYLDYTVGPHVNEESWIQDYLRGKFTRALPAFVPEIVDELNSVIPECIPTMTEGWSKVNVLEAMISVSARVGSRILVGSSLCRDLQYLDLATRYASDVQRDVNAFSYFPSILMPFVGCIVKRARSTIERATGCMKPVIEDRRNHSKQFGDGWLDKPNDMLQWLVEEAAIRKLPDEEIVRRMIPLNLAFIDALSRSLTRALIELAYHPEYIEPLRDEVEQSVVVEGWTKAAMNKMMKLDSFLKETLRHNSLSLVILSRVAMKDVTLVDGTGDPSGYPNANIFNPFRFSRIREEEGKGVKQHFVATSPDWLTFGHGKHACPGRFFAASVMKATLAHILINYDMKPGSMGSRPRNTYVDRYASPDPNATVMFKLRHDTVVQGA